MLGEYDNVKAAPHASWLTNHLGQHWLHDLAEGSARDSFDRIIVQLRPGISVDGEGAWRPLPGGDQPDALIACLEAVLGSSGDRQVVVAADLAGVPDDGPAQLEHLGTMVHETADAGADGWWQTSPIDGWHWQRGFTAAPGVVDRGRTVRAAASAFNQP